MTDWDRPNVVSMMAAYATVRVSRVVYRYDVLRPATVEDAIPLGLFVDMRVERTLYGLGLMARSSVSDHEIERVGPLARGIVARPFDYLAGEFDRLVGGVDAAGEFTRLPELHSTALFVEAAQVSSIALPRHLRARPNEFGGLEAWAKDALIGACNDGFWALLDEHWPDGSFDKRSKEDVKLAA